MVGPWVYRLASDLTAERAERVRTQERADLAAHLHDSVLQTLALIQKNAGDAARSPGSPARRSATCAPGCTPARPPTRAPSAPPCAASAPRSRTATASPSRWSPSATAPFGEALRPLVNAAREAVTNAAKHAGTGKVDVYAEVTPDAVDVFVRDRGDGFDLDAVADDRYGVRNSIIDRMQRHGGQRRDPLRTRRGHRGAPAPAPSTDERESTR